MSSKPLAEIIQDLIEADRIQLSVVPDVVENIEALLSESQQDVTAVLTAVGTDPALICNLFRTANSSFYSGLQRTLSIDEAVTRIGQDKALQIIERTCQGRRGCPHGQIFTEYMPLLWQHAQACASGAQWLADRCGYQGLAMQAYLGGMLHDIGKQFLLGVL
ncbi:MAG: HDOD domain-containing protein, partial [Desulfuromonadales bacterium]|nr:HDOD domain-containing protein [Desulfuromonadales bacterium]